MSDYQEGYKPISRKLGIMAKKIAKTAQEGGIRKAADHAHRKSGLRNAIRYHLGLKPKDRPKYSNPENVRKQKKATLRSAKMAAVLDTHKPGVAQDQESINRDKGAKKYSKNKISPFERKQINAGYIYDLLDELFENKELADANRELRRRMSRGEPIGDLASKIKDLKRQQDANTLERRADKVIKQVQGKDDSPKKKTPGRGQSPQKDRDANTLTGTLSNVEAGKRKSGNNVVGGEGPGTSTGGRYGDLGTGRGGGTQSRRNRTTNRYGGNLGARSRSYGVNAGYEVNGELIERTFHGKQCGLRFRERIEEAMSPEFSRTTPQLDWDLFEKVVKARGDVQDKRAKDLSGSGNRPVRLKKEPDHYKDENDHWGRKGRGRGENSRKRREARSKARGGFNAS